MPSQFTKSLAERLNNSSQIRVKEAEEGDLVLPGRILLAPGGYHMEISKNYTVKLTKTKPVNHVRPSVDVLYKSLTEVYGENITAVVLTGMGRDGLKGAEYIKKSGGTVIAEHKSTCTIYGMPKEIIDNKLADKVLPLNKISNELIKKYRKN